MQDEQHLRNIFEFLDDFCNVAEIEHYLKTHREWLLQELINSGYQAIYPDTRLGNIVINMEFFDPCDASEIACYQKAFSKCNTEKQKEFLAYTLSMIPMEKRWTFIDHIFASEGKAFILKLANSNRINGLLPEQQKAILKEGIIRNMLAKVEEAIKQYEKMNSRFRPSLENVSWTAQLRTLKNAKTPDELYAIVNIIHQSFLGRCTLLYALAKTGVIKDLGELGYQFLSFSGSKFFEAQGSNRQKRNDAVLQLEPRF